MLISHFFRVAMATHRPDEGEMGQACVQSWPLDLMGNGPGRIEPVWRFRLKAGGSARAKKSRNGRPQSGGWHRKSGAGRDQRPGMACIAWRSASAPKARCVRAGACSEQQAVIGRLLADLCGRTSGRKSTRGPAGPLVRGQRVTPPRRGFRPTGHRPSWPA